MKLLKRLFAMLFLICVLAGSIFIYGGYRDYEKALAGKSVRKMREEIQSVRNYTTLDELPGIYLKAVLSVEDQRFYEHHGIDLIATGRAILHDIEAMAPVEGGSTITQQLAKNQYFTQEKKLTRKIAELFMAFEIEKELDKDTILELYINSIFYGNNYYCVADASMGYFGKMPSEMSEDECTLLAGVPNAPSAYNPRTNPKLARQRQKQVLRKMQKCGKVLK